jgi:hypothetical protein
MTRAIAKKFMPAFALLIAASLTSPAFADEDHGHDRGRDHGRGHHYYRPRPYVVYPQRYVYAPPPVYYRVPPPPPVAPSLNIVIPLQFR